MAAFRAIDFNAPGNACVVGLQWGDEGKGKIVDVLLEHFDVDVRYSGGANAGHTVVVGGERFALHQLPSGVIRPNVTSVIGGGTVIDPAVLVGEIESLKSRGVSIDHNLRVSDRAHLVFPYHRMEDQLAERAAGGAGRLGTTARGIGPCYSDKMSRRYGVRLCELFRPERFRERLRQIVAHKNAFFAAVYDARRPLDADAVCDEYLSFAEQIRPFVCDAVELLQELLKRGQRLLFEGAQGALLDVDYGTYPYVTSSNSGPGGVAAGAGVPARAVGTVIGVVKAYATRVGDGPFPTELHDELGARIRERGREYGTTTGRPRRCGWFDAVAARYAAAVCGADALAVVHLDSLSGLERLNLCTEYRAAGRTVRTLPADAETLRAVEPVYESLPGWPEELGACRRLEDLPPTARSYLERLSACVGVPIAMVSVGASREQIIRV